jgi:hypothetical protein
VRPERLFASQLERIEEEFNVRVVIEQAPHGGGVGSYGCISSLPVSVGGDGIMADAVMMFMKLTYRGQKTVFAFGGTVVVEDGREAGR